MNIICLFRSPGHYDKHQSLLSEAMLSQENQGDGPEPELWRKGRSTGTALCTQNAKGAAVGLTATCWTYWKWQLLS